jgi:hypothetical protein
MSIAQSYQLDLGPDIYTMIQMIADSVPDEHRAAVLVRTTAPENSSTRLSPAYDCSFLYFFDRRKTTADLVVRTQVLCSYIHDAARQRETYSQMQAKASATVIRRCCRITSTAHNWMFYDKTLGTPLIPCCTAERTNNVIRGAANHKDDIHSPFFTKLVVHQTARADNEEEFKCAIARLPDWDRYSHHAPLCRSAVRQVVNHMLETISENDSEKICAACEADLKEKLPPPPAKPNASARSGNCASCLIKTTHWLNEVRRWTKQRGVTCTRKLDCLCIYDYLIRSAGAIIELDGVVQPCDATYEVMVDSIFDRRSPIVAMMQHTKDMDQERVRRVVNSARLRRTTDNVPPILWGSSFARSFTYEKMLDNARRIYEQPDAVTLSQIAVLNKTIEPLFIGEELYNSLSQWLQPAAQRVLLDLDVKQLHARALKQFNRENGIFTANLEKVIYEEVGDARNRRMAFARVYALVIPVPNTIDRYNMATIYLSAVLAMVQLCENVALKMHEEHVVRMLATLEAEKKAKEEREKQERQEERDKKRQKRIAFVQKRAASAAADARRDKSSKTKRQNAIVVSKKGWEPPVPSPPSTDEDKPQQEEEVDRSLPLLPTPPLPPSQAINENNSDLFSLASLGSKLPQISVELPVDICFEQETTLRVSAKEFVPSQKLIEETKMRECRSLLGANLSGEIFQMN